MVIYDEISGWIYFRVVIVRVWRNWLDWCL